MFKNNDLPRTVTAAFGAVLVSLTFVGAAVMPAQGAGSVAVASSAATDQALKA